MFIRQTRLWALGALMASATQAHAAPMGFQGSVMAMGDFGENWRELYLNYALTPRDALGLSATWMRSDDRATTRQLDELTYTRLLTRWNLPHAQANLWFIGGVGRVRGEGTRGAMASPGVQFDYETTRVYFAATARLYRARGIKHDFGSVRAGFSFYEADYDQTQPWLIVEARQMRNLSDKVEVTPMLRLINKNYFIEAGVSTMRQARFNFMYIF
ncbi:MAG: hypothetical protein V4857_02225 [Pseudomonadota bacterium]